MKNKIIYSIFFVCVLLSFSSCEEKFEDVMNSEVSRNNDPSYGEIGIDDALIEGNTFDINKLKSSQVNSQYYSHQIRFAILASSRLNVSAHLLCPNAGTIYYGASYPGWTTGVVVDPLFVTSNLETYVQFQMEHPCYCVPPDHTLIVSNGLGYHKEISVGSIYTFSDMIPLDPNANTVITIYLKKN